MDLGIAGRKAIVCASSRGLGKACAEALAREGVAVTVNARNEAGLLATVQAIEATGGRATAVVADIDTEAGRAKLVAACPDADILVNNNAGPPPGKLEDWDHATWLKALESNMLAPILQIRALVPGMRARKFGRIVNITSAAVKSPIEVLGLSNGARAGLTGFVAGISRKTVINNVTINGLLPGPFNTDRVRGPVAQVEADRRGITVDQLLAERAKLNPAGRFGDPEEFGQACVFLCGAKSGFITGQNILLDGGAFPGTL